MLVVYLTGRYVFRGGKLVPTSLDIYLVTEFADQGDLFNLRGQLHEEDVRSIMYQLLSALRQVALDFITFVPPTTTATRPARTVVG